MANHDPNLALLEDYAGTYEQMLYSTAVNAMDFARHFTVMAGIKNSENLTKLSVGDGARPYSDVFVQDESSLNYIPRKLTVHEGKRELLISPSKYRKTWMSKVMDPGFNPMNIPFAGYVWGEVMKSLGAELNNKTIYFGFDKSDATVFSGAATYTAGAYVTVTTGDRVDYWKCVTNTTAGESPASTPAKWQKVNAEAIMPGLGKLLADEVTATNITPVAIGSIDNTTAYDAFVQIYRAHSDPYKASGVEIYCSYTDLELLEDNIETRITKNFKEDVTEGFYLPRTNKKAKVIPATWLSGSRRIISTAPMNILLGTDQLTDMSKINTKPNLWTLEAGMAFAMGVQIRDLDALVINDQV